MDYIFLNFNKILRKAFSVILSIVLLMGITSYNPGISAFTIVCGVTPGYQNCTTGCSSCTGANQRCSGIGTNVCCCPVKDCNIACMEREANNGPPGVNYTGGVDGPSVGFCPAPAATEHFPRRTYGIVGMNQKCCCTGPNINCDNSATGGCMGYAGNGAPFSPTTSNPSCGGGYELNGTNTCCCPVDCSNDPGGRCAGFGPGSYALFDGADSCDVYYGLDPSGKCCCGPCEEPLGGPACRIAMRVENGKTIKYSTCPISPTPSGTPTGTPTGTPSGTPTGTPSSTPTGTPTSTPTPSSTGCPPGQVNCGFGCNPGSGCCNTSSGCIFESEYCNASTNTCIPFGGCRVAFKTIKGKTIKFITCATATPTPSITSFVFPSPTMPPTSTWTVVCPGTGIKLVQSFNPEQALNYIGLNAGTSVTWMIGDQLTLGSQTFTINEIRPANGSVSFDSIVLNERPTITYPLCTEVFYSGVTTRTSSPSSSPITERGTYNTIVKKTACGTINVPEDLFFPPNICSDGFCEGKDEICGLATSEDSFGKEFLKCGCFKKCSSLNALNCSEGYCYPDTCSVISDPEDPDKKICRCIKDE